MAHFEANVLCSAFLSCMNNLHTNTQELWIVPVILLPRISRICHFQFPALRPTRNIDVSQSLAGQFDCKSESSNRNVMTIALRIARHLALSIINNMSAACHSNSQYPLIYSQPTISANANCCEWKTFDEFPLHSIRLFHFQTKIGTSLDQLRSEQTNTNQKWSLKMHLLQVECGWCETTFPSSSDGDDNGSRSSSKSMQTLTWIKTSQ